MAAAKPQNIHSVTRPELCEEIGKKYGWELIEVRETNDPILEVDCIFEGEQTSFEDTRYGD